MSPFRTIVFVLFILPFLIFKEGYKMFVKMMHKNSWWWYFIYALLAVLMLITVILYIKGYR